MQVVGSFRVDLISMIIEDVGVTRVSMTSTNHERQSAAYLWVPDIHSNVMFK